MQDWRDNSGRYHRLVQLNVALFVGNGMAGYRTSVNGILLLFSNKNISIAMKINAYDRGWPLNFLNYRLMISFQG